MTRTARLIDPARQGAGDADQPSIMLEDGTPIAPEPSLAEIDAALDSWGPRQPLFPVHQAMRVLRREVRALAHDIERALDDLTEYIAAEDRACAALPCPAAGTKGGEHCSLPRLRDAPCCMLRAALFLGEPAEFDEWSTGERR